MYFDQRRFASVFAVVAAMGATACDADAEGGGGADCAPAGMYGVSAASYTGDEGVCSKVAEALGASSKAKTLTLTKVNDSSYEATDNPNEAPSSYTLDRASCTLTRSATTTLDGVDEAGKAVKIVLTGKQKLVSSGETLTSETAIDVTSETTGALGFPCKIRVTAAGTKK